MRALTKSELIHFKGLKKRLVSSFKEKVEEVEELGMIIRSISSMIDYKKVFHIDDLGKKKRK